MSLHIREKKVVEFRVKCQSTTRRAIHPTDVHRDATQGSWVQGRGRNVQTVRRRPGKVTSEASNEICLPGHLVAETLQTCTICWHFEML